MCVALERTFFPPGGLGALPIEILGWNLPCAVVMGTFDKTAQRPQQTLLIAVAPGSQDKSQMEKQS